MKKVLINVQELLLLFFLVYNTRKLFHFTNLTFDYSLEMFTSWLYHKITSQLSIKTKHQTNII